MYEWAVNKAKLERAVKWLKDHGKEVTEESVKTRYSEIGGLLNEKLLKEVAKEEPAEEKTAPKESESKPTRRKK